MARTTRPLQQLLQKQHKHGHHQNAHRPHQLRQKKDQAPRHHQPIKIQSQATIDPAQAKNHQALEDHINVQPPRQKRSPNQQPQNHNPQRHTNDPTRATPHGAAQQ